MTREIPLTRGYVALVDDDDFEWLSAWRWAANGDVTRGIYATRSDRHGEPGRRLISMHREIVAAPKGVKVDHENGRTLDNRRSNLRHCTHKENLRNQRRRAKPGYKGIRQRGRKWWAQIAVDGRAIALGAFPTDVEAACAYDAAAVLHFGAFAQLNFSPNRDWLFVHQFVAERGGAKTDGRGPGADAAGRLTDEGSK